MVLSSSTGHDERCDYHASGHQHFHFVIFQMFQLTCSVCPSSLLLCLYLNFQLFSTSLLLIFSAYCCHFMLLITWNVLYCNPLARSRKSREISKSRESSKSCEICKSRESSNPARFGNPARVQSPARFANPVRVQIPRDLEIPRECDGRTDILSVLYSRIIMFS